jgi:hypothetical protein|tara:strand:+ start:120 stop:1778 length:1659 start_codon:yes stop_codon:yes gene_type:complete
MAKNVNIKLGANITDFESKMKRAQRGFKKTAASLKKIGKQMTFSLTAPLTAFAAASVKAFDTQAKAEAQLRTALGENETAFKNLTDQAKELQEITLFGDEETIAAASFLAQMGLQEDAIKRLIPLIQDMATAKGMSLTAAADLVAKSVGSSTNALSRYGIQIEGAVGSTERLDSAVNALSQQFKGQAQAAAEAGTGGLTQLKNSFGDLSEEIGRALMPMLNDLADKLRVLVKGMQDLSEQEIKTRVQIGLFAAALGPVVIALSSIVKAVSYLIGKFKQLRPVITGILTVFEYLAYGIAAVITAVGSEVIAIGLLISAIASYAHTLLTATDEQVKFNSALEDATVLTKEQADAIANISVPFVEGAERAKEFGIQLDKVAQVTSIDAPDGLATGLKETTHILKDVEGTMTDLGATAVGVFDNIVDRVLQFRGSFVSVLEEIGIMIGKMILKMAIMAALISVISGGGGAGRLGFSFAEAFNMQLGIGGRASGGNVIAGQPYIVGERGPEMFMPGQSGTIIPNNNLGSVSIPDVKISGEDLIIVFDRAKRHRNALG